MVRWEWKRWVLTVLAGICLIGSAALAQQPVWTSPPIAPGPVANATPRPNDTVTLRFPGQLDRKVTVMKVSMLADGNVEIEARDPMTGQTFSFMEPHRLNAAMAVAPTTRPPELSRPMPPISMMIESPKAATPVNDDATVAAGGSDRKILGSLRPSSQSPSVPSAPRVASTPILGPSTSTESVVVDDGKRPGPLQRMFGKKPAAPLTSAMPAMPAPLPGPVPPPAPTVSIPPKPATTTSIPLPMPMPGPATTRVAPPPSPSSVIPGPMPIPTPPVATSAPNGAEPPRATFMNPTSVTPPSPVVPTPIPIQTAPPSPSVVPVPSVTIPNPMPAPPGGGTLPIIPLPPGGKSQAGTPLVLTAAGNVPATVATTQELQPYIHTLSTALRPSERMLAVEALANCRHGSSIAVKTILLNTAKMDPAPMVRACCIEKLCQLGCFEPVFIELLNTACNDPSEEVRTAAKAALVKMSPRSR